MQIHELRPSIKNKKRKRVGRGGKRGTYSGRGIKGQKARAGHKIKSQLREMILKFPKRKGAGLKMKKKREKIEVKWEKIIKQFPQGGVISPKKLEEVGLVDLPKSKRYTVKIIGGEKVEAPFVIKKCLLTKKLREAILKAGGKIID